LRIRLGEHVDLVDPENDPRYNDYWALYHRLMERSGISPDVARTVVRTNTTVIGALMVRRGDADAMICGTIGKYRTHLAEIRNVIGLRSGVHTPAALNLLILNKGTFFMCDTYVSPDPTVAEISEMTALAAEEIKRFGLTPKVALLSHSNFGSHDSPSAVKMRQSLVEITRRFPDLEVEGEMHADSALSEEIRARIFPNSRLKGQANLLVMPDLDAANIAFNMTKVMGDGLSVGPILLGMDKPAHILTPSVTVRGIVNMSALATVDAQVSAWEAANKA
jgi:malate dehydrogenase (oxaloacetate-decarboxylating)(NADP+)